MGVVLALLLILLMDRPRRSVTQVASNQRPGKEVASSSRGRKQPPPPPPYDSDRFINHEAQAWFNRKKPERPSLVPESGIDFNSYGLNFLARGWYNVAQQPAYACESLVREFYANAIASGDVVNNSATVFVRGVMVPFNGLVINRYFGIPENVACEYRQIKNEIGYAVMDMKGLIEQWVLSEHQWRRRNSPMLKEGEVSERARGIHKWICRRLMPTGHHSEIITR